MNDEKILEKISTLELKISKLEEEVQLKNQCLTLIAHDFSGVSRNFQWILNSLMDGDISFEIFKSLYPEIRNNILTNNKTIESTIAWVSSQHQSFKIHPVEIRLFELFSSIKNFVKVDLKSKNIKLSFKGNENLKIRTDHVLLTFVLKSIIENAVKYSYHNSGVVFDVKQTENENISFIIADLGMGMNKQVIDALFTMTGSPYTGTDKELGAGLSLVIANDFIKLIGGTITVSSEEKKGTRIEVQAPNIP